jgi:TusA-related sulfurtransferase
MSENKQDYRDMTCTNLMIKLKVMLKKLEANRTIEIIVTREQHDNIKGPFSKKSYEYNAIQVDSNEFHVKITKKGK